MCLDVETQNFASNARKYAFVGANPCGCPSRSDLNNLQTH